MCLRVVGAGYGRTGTKSLQIALEILGYGPCYHMDKLLTTPEDLPLWLSAVESGNGWEKVFSGYQSAVDFPACLYVKGISEYFPEAKIILTVRDPESWYSSAKGTIFARSLGVWDRIYLAICAITSQRIRSLRKVEKFIQEQVWDGCFGGRFLDKSYAIDNYLSHIDSIKQAIPKDNLLLFDPRDGWQPLCDFLQITNIPSDPFPYLNRQSDYRAWIKRIIFSKGT